MVHVRGRQIIRKVSLFFDSVNIPLGYCSVHSGYNGLELQQVVWAKNKDLEDTSKQVTTNWCLGNRWAHPRESEKWEEKSTEKSNFGDTNILETKGKREPWEGECEGVARKLEEKNHKRMVSQIYKRSRFMNFVFNMLNERYLSGRCPSCSFSHNPYSSDRNPSPTPQHCPNALEYLSP